MKSNSAIVAMRALSGVAFGLLLIGGAAAQSGSGQADANPIVIYTQKPAAQISASAAALAQKATKQGRVRVMVGLRFTMRAEHTLPPAEAEQQLRALRAAQNAVATRVLGRVTGDDIVLFDFIPYMSLWVDAAQVGRLLADPQVAVVQEDVPYPPLDKQSTPLVHADTLWAKGDKGTGRTVAILDTGVAKSQPVLVGKVKSEACYSSSNGTAGVSLCPGGVTHTTATGSGVNCPTTITGCNHGTHVASIAAAAQTADLIGIAPGANLIAIKVFTKITDAATCNPAPAPCILSYATDWIQGLQRVYALRNTYHIDGANMSLGGGKYAATCDAQVPAATTAITTVRGAGIAVLVAAGNNGYDGFIGFPACISTAIAIASSTKPPEGESSFSNDSPLVKLLAPGSDIYAAVPGGYAVMSGTSMATPAVTGSYALLRQAKPKATVDDILTALICTAKTIPVLGVGRPRIDLLGAYDRLLLPKDVQREWNFSSASQANDWTPLIGNWVVSGGAYKETILNPGWIGSSTDNCNNSLAVAASVKRIAPAETSFFTNSGILFKATLDYSNNKYVSGYWLAYNKCPTDSGGNCTGNPDDPPGQAVFWRIDNAPWGAGSGAGTLLCMTQAKQVVVNGFNTVKVISQDNSHSYYLNDELVCTVSDATYAKGPVMAAAYLATAGGNDYSVDFVTITSFDTASPPAEIAALIPPDEHAGVMDPASLAPKEIPPGMSPLGSRAR